MPEYAAQQCREARALLAAHPAGPECPVCRVAALCPPRQDALEQYTRYRRLAARSPAHPNEAPPAATVRPVGRHLVNAGHTRAARTRRGRSSRPNGRSW